jgi:hypothetical protein
MVIDEFLVKEKVRSKADDAWKETLGFYFKSFMEYCWKTAYDDICWEKGFEFLEQELQNVVEHPSPLGKRVVDKLIKVWKKSGTET